MNDAHSIVDFRTDPSQYRHWQLTVEGELARLAMDVAEDGGLREGYKLKLNSYDLGVDIELHDALQRIRFEHPEVRTVVLTSNKDRIFCSGANIFMLGLSSHAWKVNFCKFTNETRNGMEDSSRHGGLKFVAAVNGACAGGGYELALACDEILLIDDRSSAVSLPEVPLLGVLPGTGGLTRVTDKRKVRHDQADIFCTLVEGVRGERAKNWRLVDEIYKPAVFEASVQQRAVELGKASRRNGKAGEGVTLTPVQRELLDNSLRYKYVEVTIDREKRQAEWVLHAPQEAGPTQMSDILALGDAWWPLQFSRELDDAMLHMRSNELEIGIWVFRSQGKAEHVLMADQTLLAHQDHWFALETLGMLRRTLARLDVTSRSLITLLEEGSCFVGSLLEVALASDRSYMLDDPELAQPVTLTLGAMNFGSLPMVSGESRLGRRFYQDSDTMQTLQDVMGEAIDAQQAERRGLVTASPDALDWEDEVRLVLEERRALSPDSLTGLEANLRFSGPENLETRVFGRLTAWQNWIFNRPNAVGEKGALNVYGTGQSAAFDWKRV
ncbi:2,3-epoxybenzoyl-CoA dihydrolase [Alcaligenes endophyticus]|uniref:2,3-epoxybenzoyl-CoA dihydrolase n=1 Tax=Alcaligenes endophyticus TaxID=1929088 RepID=A0ABT8EGZ7_9BURK|nr:2,3-epoxybenzoyl-CoA dihydrolase [Alcaligenes endophyticus]MCX5589773.1 2,3-epoxybenzoyl-CoA dihydrolase [Alcaligenes endophyticus]MDN4120564.1 2,3-epoxybenzoyl-CoA dihydrolase [Alcaligenes endophyticus]